MDAKYKNIMTKIQQEGRSVVEQDLIKDKDWVESSKKIYKMDTGKDFQGSDEEANSYGVERMGKFNYNISLGTVPDVVNIHKQDMDTKVAFAYMMDTYEDKDITMAGLGRFAKETVTDLTNYIGFGAGFLAKKTAQIPAKMLLKKTLMDEVKSYVAKPMVQASVGGATYSAGFNLAAQQVKKEAKLQPKIDKQELGVSAGVGALVGPAVVKGVEVVAPYVAKGVKEVGRQLGKGIDSINAIGEDAMAQVAGGAQNDIATKGTK